MDGKRRAYFLVAVFALLLRSTSGGCEDDVLGLADEYILDNQITASSKLNVNTPAKNGRLNYTAGSSWCASTNDSNPYLQIDLQTLHIICAVSTQGNSQGDQWVETYTLQSSTDGTTWTDYMQGGNIKVFLGNLNSKTTAKRVLFTIINARYLRVIAQDKHGSVCMRVELYGMPRLQENIALFKPTSQSSTLSTYKSSHAVDGIKNTQISQCTHTDASTNTNPWWRVDLERVEPVARVYILNRGDCCGTNLDGAEIRVGNSTTNGGMDNHLCADNIQIPQGRPKYFSCKPKAYGRYVYIIIPGNNKYLTLCEVEVYSHYDMSNLALKQPASQVSTAHGGVASRAVDGNPNNLWEENSCTHTDLATNPWWTVDLRSSFLVAEVVIVNRQCTGRCADVLKAFEIRIGDSNQNGGATNPMCGGTRSMSTGETKYFYCLPRRVGQYVSIRVQGVQKIVTTCEVQVYSTRRTVKACNNQPIGLEDSSKIPDNRFTASSSGSNKAPSLGRLNGGKAWLPATINNDEFLQIDLGSIYYVCSVATQGAPLADEWTKTYKIMTSLDNSNWTTYAESNVDKIFSGNNDRSSVIRNDLYDSPLAKFIRLYPLTYYNHKALRVEVYGSSEGCQSSLGIEDRQLFASSKSDDNHAANYSRLYSGSSWCSASASTSEYLQVDLGQRKTLTGVATQGDPTSDKWVTRYMVQFGDSNTRWFRQLIFQGNEGRDQTYVNWFSEPIETRLVRIVPLAWENSVCLRFEIYGCGVLLKVPKPTINDIQDMNLQGSKGSSVELKCNSSSKSNVMTAAIRWGNDGRDITNLASGSLTQGKFVLSTLRVNFTTAEDTLSTYNCTRQSEASRIVNCEKIFRCLAFYSSMAFRLEPVYQTAVVTVQLRVPAAVTKITVDSILGTSAVVRWQRLLVGNADESPVAVYEIKLAKESNPNTAKSFNVTGNDTSRVLEKLEQNTRYEVKVRGISAVGSGLWSSTDYFRTAKNVYCEEKILGVNTGFYPDMSVSSSQFNASTSASHSSMSYAVDIPWCANRSDLSPYLEMDLVDVHVICALSTRGNPQGEHWVETYTLQSSLDGTTWTDYKEGVQQRIFLGNYDSTSTVKEELYSGIVARKVRLHVKTFHGLACLKLQLFGVKQALENIALSQPASQVSVAHGGAASRAVDGDTSTVYSKGSCTHTNVATDAWWRVDLGSPVPVAEVVIVNRQCSAPCAGYMNSFEIKIGNSTTAADSSNQICGSSLQVVTGQRKSFRCVSTIRGRYVYIIIPGSDKVLTICEVEVYSAISNLALDKSSSQSSTVHGGSSSRAVDGGTSKDYGLNSCTHSNAEGNPWWRVDLGSSRPVGKVVIVNRDCSDACGDRLKGFEIWIGNIDEQNGGTSNRRCGTLHSLNNAETKSIYCEPRLVGRYVYIRIPGNNKILSLCEVEVYSRRDTNIVCATQPVGISDSLKILDDRLSASTFRAGNDPSKGRLIGSSAWVPSTNTNSDDYLEIDLGSVYFICGVVTQGNPSASEWTTEYKIKTSLSNDIWTWYTEHGTEKIFPGNNDQTTSRRNGLITSPLAKFIRFYPVNFSTSKALRVEVYGYAQGSKTPLGLENSDILDSQLEASSNSPAAIYGRLYNTSSWCSSTTSSLEYLQIDLGNLKTIAGVATQGDPSSYKWVEKYALRYSYGGDRWTQYQGHSHQQQIFDGNNDRNSVQANWMTGPFVARYLRIYAQTWNSGICLRVDGYGSSLVNAPIIRPLLLDKVMRKTLGSSVVMTCFVYGRPQVSVTWKTNGEEFTNSSDITSTSIRDRNWEETVSNLTFTYKDAAYAKSLFQCTRLSQETRILQCKKLGVTCNAEYFGTLLEFQSSASVSLANNLYLPEPPSLINFTNISSTSVSLTWNNPDAGDAPIQLYRVQYNPSLNLIPVTMNKTTTTRSIYISMLQPYTDYTFNVQGISAIGDGPVSKSTSLKTYLAASIFVSPPYVHKLHLHQRNVSFVCFGQGYPRPTITWKKDGNAAMFPIVSTIVSAINSSQQLNVGADGVTYQEAGNYTCEVYNGVDGMSTITATVEVIFIPEFTITPQAQTVMEGVSVIFNCNATGIPTPRISWSYNSAAELPPNSSQLSNGSLLISGVQNTVDYEGTYICSASNRAGVNVTQANLTVWAHPTISKTSRRSVTILVGYPLNLTCVIVGDPQPVVVWSKYGIQSIPGVKYESGNSSLVIPRVSITDQGVYVCLGRSDAGSVSTTFTVIVQEPAKISVTGPQVLTLLRNEKNLTVECFGRGKPRPTITWKKNGAEISKNSSEIENGVVQVIRNSSDAWNVSSVLYLRIGGVTYNDAGNYTCEVYNGVDKNDTVDSTIRVLFKPEFVEQPKHVAIVLQGNNVTLPCDVTGVPKPSIIWLFSGAKRPPSTQGEDGSLRVYSVRNNQSYEGLYSCKATSIAGILISNVTLTVDVVPSILKPLKNVTLLRGQTLNMTCFANGDPCPTVQWAKDGNSTIPRAKFSQKNFRIVIGSVQISDEGLYECNASSRAGDDNSKSIVKVQVEPKVFVDGNKTLILQKGQQDVIINCSGNGYPKPKVLWNKQTKVIPTAVEPGKNSVKQKLLSDIQNPMENVTSALYLRIGGVTYNESGNYTCTSVNGVGKNTASTRVEVIFKPEFVIAPRSKIVNEGETVTFICTASGVPEPTVTWNFKGGNLPPYSTVLNGNLTIPSVRNNKTYEGTYSCTASSRAGIATTDVVLTIHIPPQITKVLNESVVAERGDNVALSCSASGDPSPRFHWTKDGSRAIPNAAFKNSNKTLQLTNVTSRDDGVYICWAINAAGNASTSSNLSVHARPSLLKTFPKITTKIEDNATSLSCTGESIPAPAVSWFKDDEIVSGEHVKITTKGNFERVTTLSIQEVKYDNRGVYTCSFANYRGSVNSTGRLIVHVPPNILHPPASIKEKLGLRVTFNCTVRGFPLPSLVWIKDNVNLIGSEEDGITEEKDEGTILVSTFLTINQAKREDTGVYICKANNTVASTLKSASLTVLEKPDRLKAQIVKTSSRSVVLTWKVLFDGNSDVKFFTVTHNISNDIVSYNASSIKRQFKVLYLTPTTFYIFSVTATNQLGTSDRVVVNTTTLEAEPGAPRFLKPIVISSRSIFINWTVPAITNGKLVKYIVYYDRTEAYIDNSTRPMNQSLPANITWLFIKSLVPYTQYTIQVQAFTEVGGGNMSDSVGPVRTFEDVPGAPHGIAVTYAKASETYLIKWRPPLEPNGIILGYKVFLLIQRDNSEDAEIAKDKVFKIEGSSPSPDISKSVSLHELNGDKTYRIIIQARTSINFGQNSTEPVKFTTPITSPPTPPTPPPSNETTTTTAVIELTLFSDVNGEIKYYQVIVLRVPQGFQGNIPTPDDITPNDIKTYDEAHKSSEPAAYIAFVFEANKFNLHKRFTLGNGEKGSDRKRREIKMSYFNGPLEPNTQYQAFTRAFTSESQYSQSEYIKIKTKEVTVKPPPSPPSGSPTGIIAGVVVVVIIAVIGVAVFIYIRRKRRENVRAPDENELQPLGTVEARKGSSINEGLALDVDGNRGPIPVKDLKAHYIQMHKNDSRLFSEEYKSLSITGKPTTEVCDLPENKVRNRYGNIKAYDHSRVKLNMEGSSDYINGNYIDGYSRQKQYIATIGPKPETSEHFWWLIWQENVSTIVMLTRPVENGKVKCHQYWPDKGNQEHGALTVTVKETREFSEFEIRTLSLQMPSRPDLKPRAVTHFYFTAWPDHDVPDEATGLLQFWRVVKKASTNDSPMVVHCSAGVGRTGTFICIDAMMEQINAREELDIYNFVTKMRKQRNYMVQRESQYIFIFYALLEATTFGDTEIASHDLRIKVQKMAARNPRTHKSNFEREFELLDGVVHQENTDFTSALKTMNAKKNRYTNVLPFEKSRVVLKKTSEDEEEDTSYINANYLEGYQQRKAYIATQAPMRDTVGDFWRMVWEEEVHSIVKLVPPKEDSEEAFIDYWSEVEATLHGSLSIETINFDNKETYSVRKINLSETETEKVRKVTLYTCTDWPKDGVPVDSTAVINFIGTLQKQQQQTGNHPIVVHCSDGIGRTGTLCALMTSLERVKLEDTVDVFTAVRMIRTQRPGMVQTLEQYRFIYDAILAYLDSFETSLYQNFS